MPFRPLFPCVPWSRGTNILLNSGPTLGPGRVVPYSPAFNQSGAAIQNVVVVALKERLMKPGVLAASMDPFGFYRGRLLPERYAFCDLRSRQHHSLY